MPKRHGFTFVPVYRQSGTNSLDHEGSAILVGSNTRWIFTAAHVVERALVHDRQDGSTERQHAIVLPGHPQVRISGLRFKLSEDQPANPSDRPELDLAYAELFPSEAQTLLNNGLHFLPLEEVSSIEGDLPSHRNGCVFTGYPAGSVEIDEDNLKILNHPTMLTSQFLTRNELVNSRLNPQTQIGAPVKVLWEKNEQGVRIKKFNPLGLSGGPIWIIEGNNCKLVGIATEYDSKRLLLIGTRLRPMFQEIARTIHASSGRES